MRKNAYALRAIFPSVAQLDNAADSDSEDRGFESLRAGHRSPHCVAMRASERSVPYRAREVCFASEVACGSEAPSARAAHLPSLFAVGEKLHGSKAA